MQVPPIEKFLSLVHVLPWNAIMLQHLVIQFLLYYMSILFPRGRTPVGQHQESRPLASSNSIPVLNRFVNAIDWDQNQSDLSDLTQSMCRVTGSPWIVDFRCWTRPEVAILGADQKERGLWGLECYLSSGCLQDVKNKRKFHAFSSKSGRVT